MNLTDKIKINHKHKSAQLRKLKKKLKKRVPISKLEKKLVREKRYKVDWRDYYDDEAYGKEIARREARIELLESLIKEFGEK